MAATIETIDGRDVLYITDPVVRRLLEEILVVLRAKAAAVTPGPAARGAMDG